MFIAHRGKVGKNFKENTLAAFKEAINDNKYQGFELDIRTTKDKEFVVVHDFFYNTNLINKTMYQDLSKDICLLEDVLKLETDKIILLEIKERDIDINRLNSLLFKYSSKNIYVMSFYKEPIKKLLQLTVKYKCGILNYLFNSENSYNEYDFIVLLDKTITANLISYFQNRKLEVFSYGVIKENFPYQDDIYYIVDEDIFNN